jgi:hypothetical protein
MDNHPIPQDVTGFQFKLVGNMTLKQFGYVGTGIIIDVVFYYLPMNGYLKIPFMLFFGLLGMLIAFIPIEGRPFDVMATNFFKTLWRPNQFVYHKVGGKLSFTDLNLQPVLTPQQQASNLQHNRVPATAPQKQEQLRELLFNLSEEEKTPIDQKESAFINSLFNPANTQSAMVAPQQPPRPSVQPIAQAPEPTFPSVQPLPIEQPMVQQTPPAPMQFVQNVQQPAIPDVVPPVQAVPQMQAVQPVQTIPEMPPVQQQVVQPPQQAPIENGQVITTQFVQPVAPTLPATPNLLAGIVKDPRGNVIQGILVEVKNKAGESIRAFKTNALGQFASATKLPDGEFTIEFEDPKAKHTFEKVHLVTNGTPIPPLEVLSIDAREQLRRSLFG